MNKYLIGAGILGTVLVAGISWVLAQRFVGIHDIINIAPRAFFKEDFDGETWVRIFGSWDFDSSAPVPMHDAVNSVRIECGKLAMVCTEERVFVGRILKDEPYDIDVYPYQYDVVEWTDSGIVAVSHASPELGFVLHIDLNSESARLISQEYLWDETMNKENLLERSYALK